MADIELVEEEFGGVPYDITIYNRNDLDEFGRPKVISFAALGITIAKLFISTEQNLANPVLDDKTLTLVDDKIARWTIGNADVPDAGDYYAMIKFTDDATPNLIYETNLMTVHVQPRLGTA